MLNEWCWWLDEKQSWRGGECFQGNMRIRMSPELQRSAGWYRPILVLHSSCQSLKGAVTCSWTMKLKEKLTQDWFCLLTLAGKQSHLEPLQPSCSQEDGRVECEQGPGTQWCCDPLTWAALSSLWDNGRVLSKYLLIEFSVPAGRGVLIRVCVRKKADHVRKDFLAVLLRSLWFISRGGGMVGRAGGWMMGKGPEVTD